jgi:SAM-dependent methyltransferase
MSNHPTPAFNSPDYWDQRYRSGGTSGAGSYGRLAEFKAGVLNSFVAEHRIASVVEFGCGDGNQLSLAQYPRYVGVDVSATALQLCKNRFRDDRTKSFFLYRPDCFVDNHGIFSAELALSLDVIFHLIEDAIYETYMSQLFSSATRFVVVYASDEDATTADVHVRHRQFTRWVAESAPRWRLLKRIRNEYPFDPKQPDSTSFSSFFVFGAQS